MTKRAAVILDRDGVINLDSDGYVKSLIEFKLIPKSVQAIADLHQAGWPVFVVTNQSGLERGYYDEATLAQMHAELYRQVQELGGDIQAIYYCPHHPKAECECRKPKPGLFKQLALDYEVDLSQSYYVGDKVTDVEVALAVDAQAILVTTGKGAKFVEHELVIKHAVPIYTELHEFAQHLISDSYTPKQYTN